MGDRHDVPDFKRVVLEVSQGVARWPEFAEEAHVDATTMEVIGLDLERFRPR